MPSNDQRPGREPQAPKPNDLEPNVARPRTLRKAPIIAQPVSVTQVTSEVMLGIPERRFREWVRSRQIPHARLGKLVIVELSVALTALRAEAGDTETPAPTTEIERIRAAAGIRVGAR